jgi:hypothetical protein
MADDILDPLMSPEPFDLGSMVQPAQQQQQHAPQPTPPTHQHKRGGIAVNAALAAIMPLIAKQYGPTGMASLMRGYQAAEQQARQTSDQQAQQDFQNQRLTQQDQRAQATADAQEKDRQQTLATQQAQARSALAKNYVADLEAATTPEQIDAIRAMYQEAGAQIGFRPGTLDQLAKQIASPSALLERRVRNVVKGIKSDDLERLLQAGVTLQIDGEQVPFEVWSHYVPHAVDEAGKPLASKKPSTANTPTEHAQDRYAQEHGYPSWDEVPYAEQLKVMKEVTAAQRAPERPATATRESTSRYQARVKRFRDSMVFAARQNQSPEAVADLQRRAGDLGLAWDEEVDRASRAAQADATKSARARDLARGSGEAIPDVADYSGRFGGAATPVGRGGRAGGPGPAPGSQAPAPASPRTATRADVQKVADSLKVPYAEAERQLKARGVVLVGQ